MAEQNRVEVKTNYEVYQNDILLNRFNVYSGLVRMNDIPAAAIGKRPRGWFVREKFDAEANKSISLELGVYLNEDTFLGIPVHFTMKEMFAKFQANDTEYNYYQVPMSVKFAVSQYVSKKDGTMRPILVHPDEKHPPVFIVAFATNAKVGVILNCKFAKILPPVDTNPGQVPVPNIEDLDPETCGVKVLKKYFDKDRDVIAGIAFSNVSETEPSDIVLHLTYGVPGTTVNTTEELIDFKSTGWNTETFALKAETPREIEFINFPMYLETSKRQLMLKNGEDKKPPFNKKKPFKKPFNKEETKKQ